MRSYTIKMMADGKWRNMDCDYVSFGEHLIPGVHANCTKCICSYCGEPAVFVMTKLEHKITGQLGGHLYCNECLTDDYNQKK